MWYFSILNRSITVWYKTEHVLSCHKQLFVNRTMVGQTPRSRSSARWKLYLGHAFAPSDLDRSKVSHRMITNVNIFSKWCNFVKRWWKALLIQGLCMEHFYNATKHYSAEILLIKWCHKIRNVIGLLDFSGR